jgi:DNA-binding transcriptional LysR family regulator
MAVLGPGLEGRFLFSEELVLALPLSHPKVHGPADIEVRSLATFARGCTYRQLAVDWLEGAGGKPGRQLQPLELSSYHAILACVTAGAAVAIVPQSLLDLHRHTPDVNTVPVRTAHSFLIWRSGFTTAAFEAFSRELQDT